MAVYDGVTAWLIRLEPMLARIHEDRRTVVCPIIDVISDRSLAYGAIGAESVGGFWWSLHFSWRPMPHRERKRRKSPVDSIRLDLCWIRSLVKLPVWPGFSIYVMCFCKNSFKISSLPRTTNSNALKLLLGVLEDSNSFSWVFFQR